MLPPPTVGPADLGIEIGRHDALGGGQDRSGGERGHRLRQRRQHRLDRQAPADDAGRAGQDLAGWQPEQPRGLGADALRRRHAAGRADVGDLVVDDDRAERRPRPAAGGRRCTGAPGKALRVNTAAKSGVGRSSAISVSVIFAGFGASRGMKSKRARADAKAGGQRAWLGEPRAMGGRGWRK